MMDHRAIRQAPDLVALIAVALIPLIWATVLVCDPDDIDWLDQAQAADPLIGAGLGAKALDRGFQVFAILALDGKVQHSCELRVANFGEHGGGQKVDGLAIDDQGHAIQRLVGQSVGGVVVQLA